MDSCPECNKKFKNKDVLDKHISSNQCQNYKNVIISCNRCGMKIKNFMSINSHFKTCETKQFGDKSVELYLRYQVERIKNMVLTSFLESKNYDISNIFKEDENNLNLYSNEEYKIPITIHDHINNIVITKEIKNTTPKNQDMIVVNDSSEDEYENQHQQPIKEQFNIYESFELNINIEELTQEIANGFNMISKPGVQITPILTDICKLRQSLSSKLTISQYQDLINKHLNLFNISIANRTSFGQNKKKDFIKILFTNLELRLIFYEDYTETTISADDITHFKTIWNNTIQHPKKYVIYNPDYNQYFNYSLGLHSISECIEKVLFNSNGYNNVIYSPYNRTKNNKDDPFHFYYLKSISSDNIKKKWVLDNRCVNIAKYISENLLPYTIQMFRRIYMDVFHDNTYRKVLTSPQIIELECTRLMKNILILANVVKLRQIIQQMIIHKATYSRGVNDIFDLSTDDTLIADKINSEKPDVSHIRYNIQQVFDDITGEEVSDVISKFS